MQVLVKVDDFVPPTVFEIVAVVVGTFVVVFRVCA